MRRGEPNLPSYLFHTKRVRSRVEEIESRPKVLEVTELSRRFTSATGVTTALDKVSLDVRQREFVSVIGPSGCGKSTLIRILAGLDHPSDGGAFLDGKPFDGPGADRGMVFQGYTLFPWLNVKSNVMFGPRLKGLPRAQAADRANEWLRVVGLSAFSEHYPSQLSGGMKQRVAIARALANEPRILLMDEPFGALDAQTRSTMQDHLIRIWNEVDVTVLFITHDLEEAIYLSDRIVVLGANPGRVLEVIDVPVERPRRRDHLLSGSFLATKRRLEELIHGAETHSKLDPDEDSTRAA
ncbi:MAG: hypothetical protein RJA70_4962 [Pseudomonadota bacterium]|jgi:NitT/TauT family transport system ATP-binding protein